MTLQEIFDIISANIAANEGSLKLAPDTISSPEITELFDKYLLNTDLVIDDAVPLLNAGSVTVKGTGNSLIFFDTNVNSLAFTVTGTVPTMTIEADAIIKAEGGWTFGKSFPVLMFGNWSGFYDPGDPKKWIQYIFFDSAHFSLTATGLIFSGFLKLDSMLSALAGLFNAEVIEVKGEVTLNKGKDGYIVTTDTVVPEMHLAGKIGTIDLKLGSFPVFTLAFSMNASAYIVDKGDNKGKPLPVLEILVETTMPINNDRIGVATVIGTQSESLIMQAILPDTMDVGIAELISLANDENLLAVMPSNIPVINDFVLKDWQLTFNTSQKSISLLTIEVGTRDDYSWAIIPGFITLKSVKLWFGMVYLNSVFSPSLAIEGIITLGTGPSAVNFIISAAFPSYVFMGALDPETPVDLKGIVAYFLGDTVANSLPNTLELGVLNIAVDPKNSTYSLETALTTDMQIPVILTTIVVRTVSFNISYVAGVPSGSITGEFQVGTGDEAPFLFVTAEYAGEEDTWVFSGGLKDGSTIKLKQLIDTYLPVEYHKFNPFDITITTLFASFTQAPPATPGNEDGAENTYNFKLGAEWKLDLGLSSPFIITGLTEIAYKKSLTGSPYTGFIEGALNFGNIHVGARVDFRDAYNDYTFFFNGFEAKLTQNAEKDSIICFKFTDDSTLGGMIELLINAATGQSITLPSPWNVMNNIRLADFGFSFNITKNKIGFTVPIGINLGFIDIKKITLYYTYFPNDPNKEGIVEIQITEGSFLGGALPLPGPWDVAKPETAPAVPGQGENLFRLEFLGMGQHVSLIDPKSPNSVSEAITMLKDSFESDKKDPDPTNPIDGTKLKFNSSSNWLIGSQFVIVDTFAIGIVFFDPDLYGLSIYVDGPKAKVFQGLKFEILYKKVTDTVGVYQVYLKLPDAIRQIDFGTVSVTLPSIKIYIYTNGDFKIDFGFPLNDDFSESFGLQLLPFIGSGGFYFGVLSAETAETVPASTIGNFSPVIVFGVGLRVGVGKEINKGILKAGISIVVQGLLEGTFASFNYYDGNKDDITYYYVLGKISIVGHVYGAIDFLIISAEVDLKVFVSARIVFESYEPILITLSAGVSVSVKVRINLGLFKITIGLSFSTTIEFSFTIGKRELKPWDGKGLYAAQFRQLSLQALDEETDCLFLPVMNWLPIIPVTKVDLEIIYIPQFTVATDEGSAEQKARVVAMLYLESAIDQPTTKQQLLINGVIEEVDYPFTKFAKGAFLWVLGAYFNKTTEGIPVDTILAQEVTIANLNEIICYFSQNDLVEPFSVEQVFTFMENYLNATITTPARTTQVVAEKTVSVLPMLPNLVFGTPAGDIHFDNKEAEYTYDQLQLRLVHDYFRALSVRNTGANTKNPSILPIDEEKQSLATFMLIDYIALLAKESTQKGIDRLTTMVVPVDEGDSFESIVADNPHFGISAIELAHANRTRKLSVNVGLNLKRVPYTVRHNDTLHSISKRFNVGHNEILQANIFLREQVVDPCLPTGQLMQTSERLFGADENNQFIAGERIFIPNVKYTTSANEHETLLSVANKHGIDVLDLIAENIGVAGLLPHQSKILVPFVEKITVADLIKAMEENHDFEHLSGLSANMMLQGLRVPLPEKDSAIGKPEAMYKISGQEIDASKLVDGDELILKLPESLPWLNLGTPGGTELPFTLLGVDIGALQDLQKAKLKPVIVELKASDLFRVQPRKFSLPSNITWALPVPMTLMNGDNLLQDNIDPSIWMFKNSLQALLSGYDAIAPKVSLLKQVQETKTRTAKPVPINDYTWSTKIDVRLRQVKSSEDPAKLMPNVYELHGIDPASMSLLQNLIEYYAANPGTIINQIDILYSKDPAQDGQKEPPSGLRSDSIANTSMYLLQTNLSTLSNPPQLASARALGAVPGMQDNLLGMSQLDFLTYMWEAAIVGTGGYYLYYLVKDSKNGLPDYLFNGDTEVTISVVITYDITNNVLHNFLNSVIIREPINIQDEILYIETLAQTVSDVTMAEGETLHAFARRYSTTVGEIATQNKTAHFRKNTRLAIPGSKANAAQNGHLTAAAESLEVLAEKYGVSIIALAHANKHQPQLFEAPLTFDSRIEVKVATVPPGNIGFTMKRKGPEAVTPLTDAEQNLQELYNLLGYNIAKNDDFDEAVAGLPAAPGDNNPPPPSDLDEPMRPTGVTDEDMPYNRIVPVYPFVKTVVTDASSEDLPPEKEDPYRAVGKTVQIDMRWQDIFGNLTSFQNIPDPGPAILPDITVGYTDPVIGLSLFPSVSASYIVDKPEGGSPNLYITLAFNPTNYLPVESAADVAWKKRAEADRGTYVQIYYQLIQEDMKVIISNSLEGDTGLAAIETDPKAVLTNMVIAIYQYLGEILKPGADPYVFYTVEEGDTLEKIATKYDTTPQNIRMANPSIPADGKLKEGEVIIVPLVTIPANQIIESPVSDSNPLALFALVTKLKLARELDLVDDGFKDEPSVLFSTSVLGPNLTKDNSASFGGPGSAITIQEFAQKLQAAFPELKAASGMPKLGTEDNSPIDIWVARFNDSATGIQFSIPDVGNPYYFALLPLATHLLSRDMVKIYPYHTGTPISDETPLESAFNGIDIEKMAQTCLAAIDIFLQADFSIPAWQIENTIDKPLSDSGAGAILHPYQYIINAKKELAGNIVKHMATVLADDNKPNDHNLANAMERLRQELLISLSNAYSIDTVLQFNVDVKSPYNDANVIAPNLFGKVLDPNDTTQADQKAYAFSTTRFSLEKSDLGGDKQSYLTILFNSKKDNDLHGESSFFGIDLQYEINSIEHDIQNVDSIKGYKASSWLTFILPFDDADTGLGKLKIPIPLRAYPTAPSLTAQTFKSVADAAGLIENAAPVEDKLLEAKEWNYTYTYDYLRAQQDTINTGIILNVPSQSLMNARFADDEDPDLFAALLQFSNAYPGIQRDFNEFLLDQSNPDYACTAMQSFAWLVKRVATAWGKWEENRQLYADASTGEVNYKYEIVESGIVIDEQNALLISVTPRPGTKYKLPYVKIEGFITHPVDNTEELKSFAYYTMVDGKKKYLSPDDGRKITQRIIGYDKFNIINEENIWSGIAITRNKILVPGIKTNEEFIYTTPTIRFVSVLTPLLDPNIEINIADYTSEPAKQPLQLYLSNFLQALFTELIDETTTRQIKIGSSYVYDIQENIPGLSAEIPISISTPYNFAIPADWDNTLCPVLPGDITPESPFVCQLTALLQNWFAGNVPVTTNAKFRFDIELFSGLSNTQLPVLRIRNLYLEEKNIKWS
ncbi:LysM domain-containing protein [Mucilaginibacter sp.]|uniref:LysM peptidoglycan-binding domain-containing protein n=1 Tax=Mucilaginibacter sp. TaxID=1882438 RepID=UPI0025FECE42|nr:LysM domain-containing protein [Mucilaginibacter sp.]